ncbi:MAG TPA: Rieske 2Fe-2S domain-containing protein [Gaiellaceae bacterium]|nr:Rieske 2Fe-2S domain-containing protein [Gaiellaceae bacterium]
MEPHQGQDKPHLPPPSLWPIGFAIGIVCILVGLIVSWPAAAVGVAITLLFGFLWVRDVTGPYRRRDIGTEPAVAGPESATTGAPPIPADRGEAAMPEPAPGERFPRSVFLEGATLGLGSVIAGVVTVPIVGFAIAPVFQHVHHDEVDVGPITNFKQGEFVITTFLLNPSEGEITRRTAYIRNNGFVSNVPSFTVLSNRCAHLGCPVQPNGPEFTKREVKEKTKNGEVTLIPVLPAGGFGCPCHGGQYDQEGNRTAGPPVRALDRYEFYIRNGRLTLGKTYSVAKVIGAGATAKIKKYKTAGPGQHIDGWEQWLYPLQPPS